MTQSANNPIDTFTYEAIAPDGQGIAGSIDAGDALLARQKLESLGLKLTQLSLVQKSRPRPLRTDDFLAFNQELASLAQAGLPIEQGLRLIAQDLQNGRLAMVVRELADELEKGTPLPQAFEKFRGQFPSLYGNLIDAGMKSSNLPGVLLNLNQHVQTMQRLRRAMWNAFAYPAALVVVMVSVLCFMGLKVFPEFDGIFRDFHAALPGITVLFMNITHAMPQIVTAIAVLFAFAIAIVFVLRATGAKRFVIDYFVIHLPLIGVAVRKSLIARWCSAMRVGVDAGLDLPTAMELAAQSIDSPKLQRDTRMMVDTLMDGGHLDQVKTSLLPPILPAAIELGTTRGDLPGTLTALTQMNQRQADFRISAIPVTLIPAVVIVFGFIVSCIILALFAPLISLIQSLSGGGSHPWWL